MKNIRRFVSPSRVVEALIAAGVLMGGVQASHAAAFTSGDLAVVLVGDGTTTLNGLGNTVAIEEFTTAGSAVQTISIPQTGGTPISLTGNATAEGALSLSADGSSLTFAAYESAHLSSGTLAGNTAATTPRAIVQIAADGSISIPVISTTSFSANSHRAAITDGAGNYWSQGVGAGVTYQGNTTTAATIETAQTTLRVLRLVQGNITFSGAGGVYQVTGQPKTGTATVTQIINNTGTGTGTTSSYGFSFNPSMTLAYVSDDRTNPNGGGVQRYHFNGSTWVYDYSLNPGGSSTGTRGLVVDWTTGNIFATTTETSANRIVEWVADTGAGSAATTLATAPASEVFRGIDFAPVAVPEPATWSLFGLGALALGYFRRKRK